MPNERNEKASSPGLVGSSRGRIRGSDASTIFESRLQSEVPAKESAEKSTQSEASTPVEVSTKKQATTATTQVQPTPPPTSSNSRNSSRSRRLSASLPVPSDLTDSQILDLGSTDEHDEGDKDDENNEDDERKKEHTGRMVNVRWRNKNLFPARKEGDPDYDLDPRDFNRRFEEQARAAKRAEEEAAKRAEEEAAKRAEALLVFEMLLAKEHLNLQRSHAKELSATHSWPAKTKSYFYTTFSSSKKSKEPTKGPPIQSAKTWPVRNLFTAKKKVEGLLDPKAKESHLDSRNEVFRGLVRRFTFGSSTRDP